jgi:hypothetical protein
LLRERQNCASKRKFDLPLDALPSPQTVIVTKECAIRFKMRTDIWRD